MTNVDGKAIEGKLQSSQLQPLDNLYKTMLPQLRETLPSFIEPEAFMRFFMVAYNQNPKLKSCSEASIITALMDSASAGIIPFTVMQEAVILPYGKWDKDRKVTVYQAKFQLMYRGIITLAERLGEYTEIYASEVYCNDYFEWEYGLDKFLRHKPADISEGEPSHFYAVYKKLNGGKHFVVWSRARVIEHMKKYTKVDLSDKEAIWNKSFTPMALKTMLKEVLKYAPKSVKFMKLLAKDLELKAAFTPDASDFTPEAEDELKNMITAQIETTATDTTEKPTKKIDKPKPDVAMINQEQVDNISELAQMYSWSDDRVDAMIQEKYGKVRLMLTAEEAAHIITSMGKKIEDSNKKRADDKVKTEAAPPAPDVPKADAEVQAVLDESPEPPATKPVEKPSLLDAIGAEQGDSFLKSLKEQEDYHKKIADKLGMNKPKEEDK